MTPRGTFTIFVVTQKAYDRAYFTDAFVYG